MNRFQLLLALGMLITGSINTIATKVADWQRAPGASYNDPCPLWPGDNSTSVDARKPCAFIHPFFQALFMFIGEFTCLGAFYAQRAWQRSRNQPVKPALPFKQMYIFLLPACCDMTATSTMYIGLLLTYASFFQMLRGSVVIFTALISRVFLRRYLRPYHLLGILFVLIGTLIVGADSVIHPDHSASAPRNPVLGNILIIAAQVIVAIQMCIEEVFVGGKDVPALQAVGLEGLFGTTVLSLVLIVMYYMPGLAGLSETPQHFEDAKDALLQVFASGNVTLLLSMLAMLLSIAFFNFFGISVTKSMSAAHRMVLDSVRVAVVWGFSLVVRAVDPTSGHGQKFSYIQAIGFVVLLSGTLIYNQLIKLPCESCREPAKVVDADLLDPPLLGQASNVHPTFRVGAIHAEAGADGLAPLVVNQGARKVVD